MKGVWLDRSGLLKNTTFAILAPDGKTKLTRAGRGPFHEYRNARQMAAGMERIAAQYRAQADKPGSDTRLPLAQSVEIGLNISAADNIPMIVLHASDPESAAALEQKLLPLVWNDDEITGQFTYATSSRAKELSSITGIRGELDRRNAILLVEPGQFGLSGKVLSQFDANVDSDTLKAAMIDTIMNCKRVTKDHNSHVNLGIQLGVDWESAIPESDPESVRARQRKRGTR